MYGTYIPNRFSHNSHGIAGKFIWMLYVCRILVIFLRPFLLHTSLVVGPFRFLSVYGWLIFLSHLDTSFSITSPFHITCTALVLFVRHPHLMVFCLLIFFLFCYVCVCVFVVLCLHFNIHYMKMYGISSWSCVFVWAYKP